MKIFLQVLLAFQNFLTFWKAVLTYESEADSFNCLLSHVFSDKRLQRQN